MKKLFNHTKRPYEEADFEWEDMDEEAECFDEEYAGEFSEEFDVEEYGSGEYAETDESGEYEEYEDADGEEFIEFEELSEEFSEEFADEEYEDAAEAEAYEESGDLESLDGEVLYEDGGYEDEVYDEPGDEDLIYDEDEACEESGDEDLIYDDDEAYDDVEEEDEVLPWSAMEDKNFFQKFWYKLLHMGTLDKVMATTGVLVLVLAILTGAFYMNTAGLSEQTASMETIGSELDGITVIGERGLMAVADAQVARIAMINAVLQEEEEQPTPPPAEYEETEYTREVAVSLNMASVEKDLKIKFINTKTKKLIGNVPFSVTVTTPDGKTETWSDDDMDGVIYRSGITPGDYRVAINALTEDKYAEYKFSTEAKKVTVKKEIVYEKIDVVDEIKTEAEVNSKKEDTAENDTVVESVLTDTVAWVESTRTVLDSVYTAVPKSSVPDPLATAKAGSFMRTSTVSPGDSQTPSPEPSAAPSPEPTESPSPEPSASPDPEPGPSPEPSASPSPEPTASPGPTPAASPEKIAVTGVALDKSELALTVGASETLKATVAPEDAAEKAVTWSSSDEKVAKVSKDGKVTAVAAGTAVITVTTKDGGKTANCAVTVTNEKKLTLDDKPASGSVGAVLTIKVAVSGAEKSDKIEVKSSDKAVATAEVKTALDEKGNAVLTITLVKSGKTTITVSCGKLSESFEIAVTNRSVTLKPDASTMSLLAGQSRDISVAAGDADGTFEVSSSNTDVVTVKAENAKADGKATGKITVSGVAAGSATVTISYKVTGQESVTKTVTVTVSGRDNKLTDAGKQQLYVLSSDGSYREATYADYYNDDITTFYVKSDGNIKYTGWQTIDGKLYFFDASGTKVTGEQTIQGAQYNFASDGSLVVGTSAFGIDVSKWNGSIDWNAVRNSGVGYAIIRCGYRGSSSGVLVEDPKFKTNIQGAAAAGLKVGVYFFSQATNNTEAVEEASMVLELVKGYNISYPIFLDVESSGGRADGIDKATRTAVIKTFCETIQNSGYTAGVYANKSWLTGKIDAGQLSGYKIWLAQYAASPTYGGRYDMWQYSSTGSVSGISGKVDMNLSYLGY